MIIKCFWCGALNDKSSDTCCSCKRKLQWSTFLQALMRTPSRLETSEYAGMVDQSSAAKTPVGVL